MRYDTKFADEVLQAMESETEVVVGIDDLVRGLFPEEFYKGALISTDGPEYQKVLGHVLVLLERGLVACVSDETLSANPLETHDFRITLKGHRYLNALRYPDLPQTSRDNTAERFKD